MNAANSKVMRCSKRFLGFSVRRNTSLMAKFHCLGVDTKAVRFTEAMVRDKKGFGVFK